VGTKISRTAARFVVSIVVILAGVGAIALGSSAATATDGSTGSATVTTPEHSTKSLNSLNGPQPWG
jgi:hypothetical protein